MKCSEICRNMNFSAIYKWENLINGKVYIGQTKNVYRRFRPYYFSNPHFRNAVEHYGIDNFDITFIETDVPIEMLDEREEYWIKQYDSSNQDKGYNVYNSANSPMGTHWSEETRKKSLRTRQLMHRHCTDDTKTKMREAMKEYGRCTPVEQIDIKTREIVATFPSISEASRKSGCEKSSIIRIIKGKQRKTNGYYFREAM